MAAPSGISRLPFEPLVQIFDCFHDDFFNLERHITLAQVCTLWRDVILKTPSIKIYRYVFFRGSNVKRSKPIALHSFFYYCKALKCTLRNGKIVGYSITVAPSSPSLEMVSWKQWRHRGLVKGDVPVPLDCPILDENLFGGDWMNDFIDQQKRDWYDYHDAELSLFSRQSDPSGKSSVSNTESLEGTTNYALMLSHGLDCHTDLVAGQIGDLMDTVKDGELNMGLSVRDVAGKFAQAVTEALIEERYDVGTEHYFEVELFYPWGRSRNVGFEVTISHPHVIRWEMDED
ncbi:hypothetical protein TWF694_004401 [Orbilia ellipsospora]|uniref:F-box domain-containing protein n=1 Tax=Orbilia ellipsospora TaxID=2528407 RepID=A0AAV9WV68_9PEZI